MEYSEYLKSSAVETPAWLKMRSDDGVIVSSRVRLARNLSGNLFPCHLGTALRVELWRKMEKTLLAVEELDDPVSVEMGALSGVPKHILFERHLISREHLKNGDGSGLVMRSDESMSVMVNEEDHLRLQCFGPGLSLDKIWRRIDKLDSSIERKVNYAFSSTMGYLTCCPTNVGTGMRGSVILHLPALALLEEMGAILVAIAKIGLMVRGLWGEGSDIAGHMFQISNQITLGKEEDEIIEHIAHTVGEIAEHERNARDRLMEEHIVVLQDYVGRARGVLDNAHLLTSAEALNLLSALRLGVDTGLISDYQRVHIDELLLLTQPAHLQMMEGMQLEEGERDEVRAQLVRNKLNEFEKLN